MLQTVAQRLLLLRTKTGLLGGKINDLKWKRGEKGEKHVVEEGDRPFGGK